MPSSDALASAPSFIFTKKGFVSVLVIRHTVVSACAAPANAMPVSTVLKSSFFMVSSQYNKPEPVARLSATMAEKWDTSINK